MLKRLRRSRGFTLVELMIVVAIIGILAALAIYGVRKYLTSAKTGEAKNNLGRLAKDAAGAYQRENMASALLAANAATAISHRLCSSATAAVPATIPAASKVQPDPAAWRVGNATTGWPCLRFSLNDPVYYQYNYTATNPLLPTGVFSALAVGDLDGDGTAGAAWTFNGSILNNEVRLATTMAEPADPEE